MHRLKALIIKAALICMTAASIILCQSSICFAGVEYVNPDNGYEVLIYDDADLLTDSEEARLAEDMEPITQYGGVAFVSIDVNTVGTTAAYAKDVYATFFGSSSGTVFLIDMDNRVIYIHSNGRIYKTVDTAYANTITDNVYEYASDGDYYKCASTAYKQIYQILQGGTIPQPMKYICNGLLSLIIGFTITFFIVKSSSRKRAPKDSEVLNAIFTKCDVIDPYAQFTYQTSRYSPPSSSSGGGGGGGHGGGGGGGGGGHSF